MLLVVILVPLFGVALVGSAESNVKPPQIYVYTRDPIKNGEPNELICHCKNFHPPIIDLKLKHNGEEYKDLFQSDMSFDQDWSYYITKSSKFTPQEGVKYSCDVKHSDGPVKSIVLDMVRSRAAHIQWGT
ncbi:PREDICTED: beta-2-microglobulin [Nanorana parkeri]|uniref:beta-2-microglobulin n=1 Tax=Nanorana parkeri TaxID=125878 RepID=UPI0008549D7E|nr:PREDICTED: beta-2-microglobulin [Nanorana parkeri]